MTLFTKYEPWTEAEWWKAGYKDALLCNQARYDGSDLCEDALAAYIHGYSEGFHKMKSTTPCERMYDTDPFDWEETTYVYPGLIPERWKLLCVVIFWVVACFFLFWLPLLWWLEVRP